MEDPEKVFTVLRDNEDYWLELGLHGQDLVDSLVMSQTKEVGSNDR